MRLKKKVASLLVLCGCLSMCFSSVALAASTSNYWTNRETVQFFYDGYIQFAPAYAPYSDEGYGVEIGEHVSQAYINYTRDGDSVIGGRKYTAVASDMTSSKVYFTSASCTDTINPFAAKTRFWYDWIYFY